MDTVTPATLDAVPSDDEQMEDLLARDYQEQLLEIALQQNTILYLPTGSGKTYVALMLIKAKLDQLEGDIGLGGKRTVFMVNTVPLVLQQATYIARFLPVNIGMYSGDMNVDVWCKSQWDAELRKNKVLVMTCQIFLDMLLHDYISLEDTNLLIFDECHHAVVDQPMRQVMATFQDCLHPPRVLGLTATLLNSTVPLNKVPQTISSLERTFHGTIATVDDMAKVVRFSTNPEEHLTVFGQSKVSLDETPLQAAFSHMKELLRSVRMCTEEEVTLLEQVPPLGSSPIRSIKKELTSKLVNELDDIIFHLKLLGLYGAYKATIAHNINFIRLQRRVKAEEASIICDAILTFCTHIMKIMYDEMMRRYPADGDITANHIVGFVTPQVLEMFNILRKFNGIVKQQEEEKQNLEKRSIEMSLRTTAKEKPPAMLVFVKRRATAQVLYNIVKDLAKLDKDFDHIRCDFIVGFSASNVAYVHEATFLKKVNSKVIKRFNMNEVNVLFSTSVLEEGIDIPQCSMVVKFDYPENYRSYVQSKGRARHKTSQYYMMVPDIELDKFSAKLKKYRMTEQTLQQLLVGRSSSREEPKEAEIESELYEQELEPYYTDGPGSAKVTQVSAISLLNRYCSCLPQDKFTILVPYWYLSKDGRSCFLQLPINCPIRELIQGKAMNTKKMAKRAVALKACEILHKAGELNEHLLPVVAVDWKLGVFEHLLPLWVEEDCSISCHLPGTRKRKRKYMQKFPELLVECRPQSYKRTYLHVLRLRPAYPQPSHSDNRKLVVHQLLHDTRDFAILSSKPLHEVCHFPIFMNVGELLVEVVTCARELTLSPQQICAAKEFNTMIFMDLVKVCKSFMVVDNEDKEQSYFVVPVMLDGDGLYDVDWDLVYNNTEIPPVVRPPEESRMHAAISRKDLELKVVVPWYRANYVEQFYIVTKVDEKLTTMSDFPTPDFSTFKNYFKKKYDLTIFRPEQPLLEVKSISNKIQFLKPRKVVGVKGISKRKRQELQDDFEEMLVPELCQVFQFPSALWLKATCLPSMLHRLTHLLLAEELRRCINIGTGVGCVSLPRGSQWQALRVDGTLDVDSTAATSQPSKVHVLSTISSMVRGLSLGPSTTDHQPTDIYREDELSIVDVLQYDEYVCKLPASCTLQTSVSNIENTTQLATDWRPPTLPAVVREPVLKVLDASDDEVGPQLCSVFQAVCTSSANDIVNMERLETLGDSFLKLVVSLYLFSSFPRHDEGKLTQVKGKIVGNRHLFYCGRHIDLPGIMKVQDFAPLSDWIPPGLCVLRSLQESLRLLEVSPNILYDIHVPESEQRAGDMSDELRASVEQQLLAWDGDQSVHSSMEVFLSQRSVSDKAVADCVEALIGAYLQSNGLRCALEVVCWLKVLPCEDASPEVLFDTPPSSARLGEGSIDLHLKAVDLLEEQLQYKFKDRAYLLQALTHPSYITNNITECYQRLEFIGDAILDFLITGYIYEHCGNLTPGEVTDLRSALVNNVTFGSLAARNGFHKFMLFSSVHLMDAIEAFVSFQEERNHVVNDDVLLLLTEKDILLAEAVEVPKALADMFESIAGAIYLDSQKSLHEVWRVYYRLMENEIKNFSKKIPKQPTRMLYEVAPNPPIYLKPRPLDNLRMVCVTLELLIKNKKEVFFGFGENKVEGKRAAAKLALRHLFSGNAV